MYQNIFGIIQLHSEGILQRKIYVQVNVLHSTVGSIVYKFKKYGTTVNWPRSDAPRKIGLRSRRRLLKNKKKITNDYSERVKN